MTDDGNTTEWDEYAETTIDRPPLPDAAAPEPVPAAEDETPTVEIDPRSATPPTGIEMLAGYEPGFEAGRVYGERRGAERILDAFREEMIACGTDAGVAFLVADRLRRKAGLPGY